MPGSSALPWPPWAASSEPETPLCVLFVSLGCFLRKNGEGVGELSELPRPEACCRRPRPELSKSTSATSATSAPASAARSCEKGCLCAGNGRLRPHHRQRRSRLHRVGQRVSLGPPQGVFSSFCVFRQCSSHFSSLSRRPVASWR